jgi:archaeosine-15-forming tRNA-guanine transglycosylase
MANGDSILVVEDDDDVLAIGHGGLEAEEYLSLAHAETNRSALARGFRALIALCT